MEKRMKVGIVVLLCLAFALGSAVTYLVVGAPYPTNINTVYVNHPPLHEADYIVGVFNSTHYYAKNGTTGDYDYILSNFKTLLSNIIKDNTKIYIMEGDYWFTSYLTVTVHNVTIQGAGMKNTMFHANTSGGNTYNGGLINLLNCSNVELKDFGIHGHFSDGYCPQGLRGIQLVGTTHDCLVDSVYVTETNGTAIEITGNTWGSGTYPDDCPYDNTVQNCLIENIGYNPAGVAGEGNGIDIVDAYRNKILHNTIRNVAETQNGIDFYWNTHANLVEGNQIFDCSYGIAIERDSYGNHFNNTIVHNMITGTKITGIMLASWSDSNSPEIKYNKIINNYIQSNMTPTGSGIRLYGYGTSEVYFNEFRGNTICDFGTTGSQYGVRCEYCDFNVFVENTLINCGSGSDIAFRLTNSDHCDVVGNRFIENPNVAISVYQSGHVNIINNHVYSVPNVQNAIELAYSSYSKVVGNYVNGSGYIAIQLGSDCNFTLVSNNYLYWDGTRGIHVTPNNCSVTGNFIVSCTYGIYIVGDGNLVHGNMLHDCSDAIYDSGSFNTITDNKPND